MPGRRTALTVGMRIGIFEIQWHVASWSFGGGKRCENSNFREIEIADIMTEAVSTTGLHFCETNCDRSTSGYLWRSRKAKTDLLKRCVRMPDKTVMQGVTIG